MASKDDPSPGTEPPDSEKKSESGTINDKTLPPVAAPSEAALAEKAPSEAALAEKAPSEAAPAEKATAEKAPPETIAPPLRGASGDGGARWGAPIARFERGWTWLETRLITFVLMTQILALVAWVFLTGLSTPPGSDSAAGLVFRVVFGAAAAGTGAWIGFRRLPLPKRRAVTLVALAMGAALAPAWRSLGVAYFDNLKAWLQEGSTLTLMGGLRGLATRLTLWLALLGASLATSAGKHIHVDLLFRALPRRLRLPAAVINYLAAALVCFSAAWGFLDHIAIESFGARAEERAGEKVARVTEHVEHHVFLTRKQLGLDLRSLPRVLAGQRYDAWMSAAAWNRWLAEAGYEARFPDADLKNFEAPEDSPAHVPLVISPDGEATRGILVHSLGLVFPFGLLMIGLRFLLRVLLSLSGHLPVDPDEVHREELHRAEAPALDPAAGKDAGLRGGA